MSFRINIYPQYIMRITKLRRIFTTKRINGKMVRLPVMRAHRSIHIANDHPIVALAPVGQNPGHIITPIAGAEKVPLKTGMNPQPQVTGATGGMIPSSNAKDVLHDIRKALGTFPIKKKHIKKGGTIMVL